VDNGFDTILAMTGAAALDELESDSGRFDVLLTDVRMAGGMDGWYVARRARVLKPDLPVIYPDWRQRKPMADGRHTKSLLLQKPFSEGKLVSTLGMLLCR
jgi:CheY-like chemotaxis protein